MDRDWLTYFKLEWPVLLGETPVFTIDVEKEFPEVFKDELECYKGKAPVLIDDTANPEFLRFPQCLLLYKRR